MNDVVVKLPDDPLAPFTVGEGPTGVLLVHGFTGTPWEMRGLAGHLAARGLRVSSVLLAGHGDGEERLARTGWRDWWESLVRAYEPLAAGCDRVFCCGLSMGGVLALRLGAYYPLAGVGAFAAPRFLSGWAHHLVPVLKHVLRFRPHTVSDIRDPAALAELPETGRAPLVSVESLLELMKDLDRLLPRVRCPTLLVYSRVDSRVPYANMGYIASRLGTSQVTEVTLERSGHIVTVDRERERVRQATAAFIEHVVGESAG